MLIVHWTGKEGLPGVARERYVNTTKTYSHAYHQNLLSTPYEFLMSKRAAGVLQLAKQVKFNFKMFIQSPQMLRPTPKNLAWKVSLSSPFELSNAKPVEEWGLTVTDQPKEPGFMSEILKEKSELW